MGFNPLNAKLNPSYDLLALLGAHHILHVSRIRVNSAFKWLRLWGLDWALRSASEFRPWKIFMELKLKFEIFYICSVLETVRF